ncbi:hypothetical protein KIPB_004724 [Kipferlia bialata]|uniref:Uncharacterized protein n=1 Tax=Kipferlia bialata TaxID=797122 RepID=A0A9K3CW58_9EUKA|nr:hypothetical protein KIPB_004724 [Kipferlia bialata]|eukprot:g4724.t1
MNYAISGGGIRSATFSLGVMNAAMEVEQILARGHSRDASTDRDTVARSRVSSGGASPAEGSATVSMPAPLADIAVAPVPVVTQERERREGGAAGEGCVAGVSSDALFEAASPYADPDASEEMSQLMSPSVDTDFSDLPEEVEAATR